MIIERSDEYLSNTQKKRRMKENNFGKHPRCTQKRKEQSKKRRLMAKKSRRINRGK